MQSRPDLFVPSDIPTRYSLSTYHLMGSSILSRSFTIEKMDDEQQRADNDDAGNTSIVSTGSAMDIDEPKAKEPDCCGNDHDHDHNNAHEHGKNDQLEHGQEGDEGDEGEDSDDEEEVAAEVVMIPLADILNARYHSENVRLFYEPDCLKMVSIKPIKSGEQIVGTTCRRYKIY
jgi:SET domain-containing protein 6